MVVDNADDLDVLEEKNGEKGILAYLPASATGMTVFTTRDQKTAQAIAGQHIHVKEMTTATASDLFRRRVTREGFVYDHPATSDLVEELKFLPLAITQAAAYINCNPTSVREYLDIMRGTKSDLISLMSEEMGDHTRSPQAPNAVAKTWLMSFDKIFRQDPYAAKLLQYMSCIEWKAIPVSLLPEAESKAQLRRAIGTLWSYSFISRRGDSEIYDMHRLVHVAAQVWVRQQGIRIKAQNSALQHLQVTFPSNDWENREVWRQYMPHAIRAMEGEETETVEVREALCQKVGLCLIVDGRVADAVRWLKKSLALRNILAKEYPDRKFSPHEFGGKHILVGR